MINSSLYNTINKKETFTNGTSKPSKFNNLFKLMSEKKVLLLQTFGTLIFQLIITFIIAFYVHTDLFTKSLNIIILFIFTIIIILILALVSMPPIIKFLLFTLFSVLIGLLLTSVKSYVSPTIIKTALIGVLSIFIIMFLFGVFLHLCTFKTPI